MMNPEVKAKWVEALRSGRYRQCRSYLRADDAFCCLGVLCDISGLAEWDQPGTAAHTAPGMYLGAETTLPTAVMAWSGLRRDNPEVVLSDGAPYTLADLNDEGTSFKEIADVIERQL